MTGPLRTEDDIFAAGAEAVTGWEIPDHVVEQLVTLIGPVAADVQARPDSTTPAADAA
ncbi:hypothetical protein [Micromonospora aurantiaca]|uniref:hypothetical protein n=1 Tax=Micromonospora aurantiaca (nom. illeg.) TaxID=47850 RepID=UPI0013C35139|nr:hypothetical protein [Micromonospora aurantiaca]